MPETKSDSAKCLSTTIAQLASGFCLDDKVWNIFGYNKRPKHGSYFNKFIKTEVLLKEKFLLRELFVSCVADCTLAVTNDYPVELRHKIAVRSIHLLLTYDGCIVAFGFQTYEEAIQYFSKSLKDYLNNEKSADVFITHANNILGELFNPVWIVSIGTLFAGDIIFNLKIYLHRRLSHPLIDDIDLNEVNSGET